MTGSKLSERWSRLLLALTVSICAISLGCVSSPGAPRIDQSQKDFAQALAIRNIGLDHLNNGRNAMAIRQLRRSEEFNPDDALTLIGLAEGYRRRGLLEDCEQYLLSAMVLDPEFHETYISFSALYIQMERYEESIPYSQHLVDDPTFDAPWRALTNRGWAELQLGRKPEARRSFEEALDYRGWYWPARLNLGIVDSQEGKRLEAIERFEWVLDEQTGGFAQSEAAYRLGEIYIGLGSRDRAIEHFAQSADLAPHGLWGKRSKDYLKLLR